MKTFPILQYQTVVKTEQQQLLDKVYIMMHQAAYIHWASKPKNVPPRGLDAETAARAFKDLSKVLGTIVDYEGTHEDFRMRVGVADETRITFRHSTSTANQYTLSDKVNKKAGQADVDKAYMRLHTNLDEVCFFVLR